MLLNRILELDDQESILLAEESWQDLLDLPVTEQILEEGLDADGGIEIKDLGYALHLKEPAPIWLVITDRYSSRKISAQEAGRWQSSIKRRVEAREEDFLLAINECLSLSLAGELFCESCLPQAGIQYVEERIERLVHLLPPLLPEEGDILEICCGSGMASQALLRLGRRPVVMDSDRCEVCQGLKAGKLEPESCMVLDARLLPSCAGLYGRFDRRFQLAGMERDTSSVCLPGGGEGPIYGLYSKRGGEYREGATGRGLEC